MLEAGNSNVEGGFYVITFDVKQKFTVICFCEAQIVLFQSFICITSVIFLAWSLMLLSLPVFGCVRNFVLIKLQLPMFLKVLQTCPIFRPVLPEQPLHTALHTLQKCPGLLLNAHRMPKENLEDSDFFQHCESLLFSAVCFLKIC